MKIVKNILKVLGVIILLLLVVSFFLPSKVRVERSITINAAPDAVFAHIGDLKKWEDWSPWEKMDPNIQNTYTGPDGAVGQKNTWKSKEVGNGSMEIIESKAGASLVTVLELPMGGQPKGGFTLESVGDSTKVVWYMDSDGKGIPWYMKPMSKYFNLGMDKFLGKDFESGLKSLKELVEKEPKADLSKLTYKVEEVTPDSTLAMDARTETITYDLLPKYFEKFFTEAYKSAKERGLKPGIPCALYHSYTATEVTVEAVLPVDKFDRGTAFPLRPIGGMKCLKVDYYGDYSKIKPAHEDIMTYAKAKKISLGTPWEEYVTDPKMEKDTAKWLTRVYYPIVVKN